MGFVHATGYLSTKSTLSVVGIDSKLGIVNVTSHVDFLKAQSLFFIIISLQFYLLFKTLWNDSYESEVFKLTIMLFTDREREFTEGPYAKGTSKDQENKRKRVESREQEIREKVKSI